MQILTKLSAKFKLGYLCDLRKSIEKSLGVWKGYFLNSLLNFVFQCCLKQTVITVSLNDSFGGHRKIVKKRGNPFAYIGIEIHHNHITFLLSKGGNRGSGTRDWVPTLKSVKFTQVSINSSVMQSCTVGLFATMGSVNLLHLTGTIKKQV